MGAKKETQNFPNHLAISSNPLMCRRQFKANSLISKGKLVAGARFDTYLPLYRARSNRLASEVANGCGSTPRVSIPR